MSPTLHTVHHANEKCCNFLGESGQVGSLETGSGTSLVIIFFFASFVLALVWVVVGSKRSQTTKPDELQKHPNVSPDIVSVSVSQDPQCVDEV